ncbi:hypothetical protein [Synechococcus sp. CS-1328]|uniref:hypothetical protein n=1 Tax=Synechococcus sp. CS-1328 TaxID=2847976 RepID=UPI00223B04BC|nr:hypothetical protein [Synechococcus sp. CS-1328]MCT0224868.1 hypothetical protein [Synechococcus sp. CS-1328]
MRRKKDEAGSTADLQCYVACEQFDQLERSAIGERMSEAGLAAAAVRDLVVKPTTDFEADFEAALT